MGSKHNTTWPEGYTGHFQLLLPMMLCFWSTLFHKVCDGSCYPDSFTFVSNFRPEHTAKFSISCKAPWSEFSSDRKRHVSYANCDILYFFVPQILSNWHVATFQLSKWRYSQKCDSPVEFLLWAYKCMPIIGYMILGSLLFVHYIAFIALES